MVNIVENRQRSIPPPKRWDWSTNVEHAPEALHNLLLFIAKNNTYDPIKLQLMSGYPLGFVASVVWVLLQLPTWTCSGHAKLSVLLAAEKVDESAVDECIGWQAEQLWNHNSRDRIDLEDEWLRYTGVPIDE